MRAFQIVAQELRDGTAGVHLSRRRLTADGEIGEFRAGMMRILKESRCRSCRWRDGPVGFDVLAQVSVAMAALAPSLLAEDLAACGERQLPPRAASLPSLRAA
jgi:hypothetical protein